MMLPLLATVLACSTNGSPTGESELPPRTSEPITDVEWRLVALESSDGATVSVTRPERYTVVFRADGTLNARADCNVCKGDYEAASGDLAVGLLACTLAHCGDTSLHDPYLQALGSGASYRRIGSTLDVDHRGGVLRFRGL